MLSQTFPGVSLGSTASSTQAHEIVLVTGATRGVGYQLAREFARHNHSLVIVSPFADELSVTSDRLHKEFNVDILPILNDLSKSDAAEEIVREANAAGWEITIIATSVGVFPRTRSSRRAVANRAAPDLILQGALAV